MKTYYKDLTREQAIDWLATNDTQGDIGDVSWWRQQAPLHSTEQLQEEIRYNIDTFGVDDTVTIIKPRARGKLTGHQKRENKLRRSFELHYSKYNIDLTWEHGGYALQTTAWLFQGYQIGYSHGERK